uniref:Uncharacterized protein n=1 Tax=Timema monikensis TaxID=170555 RepID=A0A7R9E7I5_9NEOP|nr:unnamed protein product [Timema monikensis]
MSAFLFFHERSVPSFVWRENGEPLKKNRLGRPDWDSNLDLPVVNRPVQHRSDALDHAATEAGSRTIEVTSLYRYLVEASETFVCGPPSGDPYLRYYSRKELDCHWLGDRGLKTGQIYCSSMWNSLKEHQL